MAASQNSVGSNLGLDLLDVLWSKSLLAASALAAWSLSGLISKQGLWTIVELVSLNSIRKLSDAYGTQKWLSCSNTILGEPGERKVEAPRSGGAVHAARRTSECSVEFGGETSKFHVGSSFGSGNHKIRKRT